MTIGATRIYRSLQDYAGPVITASYLSDAQFATNPEFAMAERRNAPFLRFNAQVGKTSVHPVPPPLSRSKFGSAKSNSKSKFGSSRFGGSRFGAGGGSAGGGGAVPRARRGLHYPTSQSQSQSHAQSQSQTQSRLQSQIRSQAHSRLGENSGGLGIGMDSMNVEFHKSYADDMELGLGRSRGTIGSVGFAGGSPGGVGALNTMGTVGTIRTTGTIGTIGVDELAYNETESSEQDGRRGNDLEGYAGYGAGEQYRYQDGEEPLSPITESTAYSYSTTDYSGAGGGSRGGEVPGLHGGRDAFALAPAGWGDSGRRSRRNSGASISGGGGSGSGWGGYSMGYGWGWASRSRHDREVAREQQQQQGGQEHQDQSRRSYDLESAYGTGTGSLSATTRVESHSAGGDGDRPPEYPTPPESQK